MIAESRTERKRDPFSLHHTGLQDLAFHPLDLSLAQQIAEHGSVYLIGAKRGGVVKIGHAIDVYRRLKDLRTDSPAGPFTSCPLSQDQKRSRLECTTCFPICKSMGNGSLIGKRRSAASLRNFDGNFVKG